MARSQYCSIHPASDKQLRVSASLWDNGDIRLHRLMTDSVHEQDALAGAELRFGCVRYTNLVTRQVAMDADVRLHSSMEHGEAQREAIIF